MDPVIYLDPCLYVPQGTTPQERAEDRARIVAYLWERAREMTRRGCRTVVGVPPGMEPTEAWLEA